MKCFILNELLISYERLILYEMKILNERLILYELLFFTEGLKKRVQSTTQHSTALALCL